MVLPRISRRAAVILGKAAGAVIFTVVGGAVAWLLDKERTLLYDLARDGRTIWEQRIGIVSTMAFVRKGQTAERIIQILAKGGEKNGQE